MPAWLGQMAGQIGSQAAGGAMGILAQRVGKEYDRKQWVKDWENQYPYLWEAEQRTMDLQSQHQYDMWLKTGIGGQMQEMKKAGINPGLLLGMSGSGGATVGGGASGNRPMQGTSGSSAAPIGQGMGVLTAAQVKLMEAQARNLNVDADKKQGVDTENVKADTAVKNQTIENLIQDVKSDKAKQALTEIQTMLGKNQDQWEKATMDDRITIVTSNATEAAGRAKQAEAEGEISHETYKDVISGIRYDVANKLIEGELMKAQKANTLQSTEESKQRVAESQAKINEIAESIQYNWERTWQGRDANDIAKERNRITEELGKLGIGVHAANGILDNLQQWADKNDRRFRIGKYKDATQGKDQGKGGAANYNTRGRGGTP